MPTDATADAAGNVYISETGNERTLEYDNAFNTDDIADQVFGKGGSFTTGGNNSVGLNANAMADPWSVTIDPACHLWVADLGNNRALEFDSPPPGCLLQPDVHADLRRFARSMSVPPRRRQHEHPYAHHHQHTDGDADLHPVAYQPLLHADANVRTGHTRLCD